MRMILQKVISASGYSSRRRAEELIRKGAVSIDGRIAFIGETADPEQEKITINGHILPKPANKIYIKLNKPAGYTCTNRHFPGEKNIFDLVQLPYKLFAVGRLDKDSRGLVLLTNDGDMTQKLSHPRFGHRKEYEVKIRDEVVNADMVTKKLTGGIDIGNGDGIVRAAGVKYLQNNVFVITLNEGKKRQIRRMFEALGTKVINLKRISLGRLTLGNLPEGRWDYLNEEEINNLKNTKSLKR